MSRYELHIDDKGNHFQYRVIDLGDGGDEVDRQDGFPTQKQAVKAGEKVINKFIDQAVQHRLVCHFWFHPSMNAWYLDNVLPKIVKLTAALRDSGRIQVKTMGELAEETLEHDY